MTSQAILYFYYHFYGTSGSVLDVEITTDNINFTTLSSYSNLQNDNLNPFAYKGVDLSSYIGQGIRLRFKYSRGSQGTSYQGDIAIDLVEVKACSQGQQSTLCNNANSITNQNVNYFTADILVSGFNNVSSWDVEYGPSGFFPGSGTNVNFISNPSDTSAFLITLNNLQSATSYDYYVTANCSSGSSSVFVGPQTFTTLVSCPSPTTLNYLPTGGGFTLSWLPGGQESYWNLEYGPVGFTLGSGISVSNINTNSYHISNLDDSTQYDVYLQAICDTLSSGLVDLSTWSSSLMLPYGYLFDSTIYIDTAGLSLNCSSNSLNETIVYSDDLESQGNWTGDFGTGNGYWKVNSGPTGSLYRAKQPEW